MKLHEILGKSLKPGNVGLELEVEFKPSYSAGSFYNHDHSWLMKGDQSLKNGLEFVGRNPFKVGPTLLPKIKAITEPLAASGMVDEGNPRGSFHVHVNVLGKTLVQIWNAVTAYWLIEDVLLRYCAPHRYYNHFCLRMNSAPGLIAACVSDINNHASFNSFPENTFKYSALNLATVRTFGSLEFRAMHSTLDANAIHLWTTSLFSLVENAGDKFSDPSEVMEAYLNSSKDEFLFLLLPPDMVSKLAEHRDYYSSLHSSKRRVSGIAYAVQDWAAWQTTVESKLTETSSPDIFTTEESLFP